MCGNLASMHMRNLECAIVVLAKLRGYFRCVGVVCALVAFSSFSMCSTISAFVRFGDFCRGEGTQTRVLFKICLHIPFCCGGGVVWRCRAVGGASDGGVKEKPLNNPLKTSVSRLLFCYYLTKRGFLQKSRPLLDSLNRHAAIALTTRSWWTSSASIWLRVTRTMKRNNLWHKKYHYFLGGVEIYLYICKCMFNY